MDAEERDLLWHAVDSVDESFQKECKSLSGDEAKDHCERTNALLRNAWRIVTSALPERAA